MKKVLITGCFGHIGSELVYAMREKLGAENVIATSIRVRDPESHVVKGGHFELLDVTDFDEFMKIVKTHEVDTIFHLAALLSAASEARPQFAWNLNMGGLMNALEVARTLDCKLFTISSIAAFGSNTPADNTPQDTIQRPSSIYGATKVAGELLCDYYHYKYGVDTRSVRFPGLISYNSLPGGGGTGDYALESFYAALKKEKFTANLSAGTFMDMMYMPDAINAIIALVETEPTKLKHRNAFNVSAMSFDPETLATTIRKYIPDFELDYDIDPVRQRIADSWPNSMDCSAAREEWGFTPQYNLDRMTQDMLLRLAEKLDIEFEI